jgi:hypothetical protein
LTYSIISRFFCYSDAHSNRVKNSIMSINLLDVVALTVDIPEYNLSQGQVGTVVEILASGKAFEVEFSDFHSERLCQRDGRTYESVGLRPTQFMVLCFDRSSPSMVAV